MTLVVLLALGAAVLHATWNVLLKASLDPLPVTARALAASALVVAPLTLAGWLATGRPGLPPAAWAVMAASAAAEVLYFVQLSRAYRAGELSEVYPIARGTGPLIAIAGGILLLREKLTPAEVAGVVALVAGIWIVRRPRPGPALMPALLTGIFIGVYTTLDRVGVSLGPAWLYGGSLWIAMAVGLAAWTRGRPLVSAGTGGWRAPLRIGLLMAAAYGLTLLAMTMAPVSVVAPLRESAVVIVTAWGVWRLGEREGAPRRLAGAAAILLGIVLIAAA